MENIFPQKRELSGDGKYWKKEADIAREKVKELEERNKVLEDALKGVVDNWTERMSGDIEVWKDPSSSVSGKGYYSPSASLVSSEFIAKGREALSNNHK